METIRVNQESRCPFNPFNILCTEILLPYNQGTVIFSNFAELAGVNLAPPWVLNSYSATRMLNRRVHRLLFVAIDCTVQSLTANNFKLLDSHLDILLSVLTNDVENIIRFHIIRSVIEHNLMRL